MKRESVLYYLGQHLYFGCLSEFFQKERTELLNFEKDLYIVKTLLVTMSEKTKEVERNGKN